MALDTRNTPVRFRPRPLSGAPDTGATPGMLLLDGQQRLTTLYHCLRGDGYVDSVDYRGRPVRRTFYVDLRRATQADVLPDEAVFAVDEDGNVRSHFAPEIPGGLPDREAALRHHCIPVSTLLRDDATDYLFDLIGADSEHNRDEVKDFFTDTVNPLAAYTVPVIRVSRETARSGVGSIFAQANSAGLQMDVFDLLTAVFAAEDETFSLAEHWQRVERDLRSYPALDAVDRTAFLTAVSLLVTSRRGHAAGNREDILELSLEDFLDASEDLRITLKESAEFLLQRCIFDLSQVPYAPQIIPLAVILARLSDTPGALSSSHAWDRLNQWFWCGVFGELYGSAAVVNRMARDVDEVTGWVRGDVDDTPKTVRDAAFHQDRLYSADADSGVYHGLYALLMSRGARDWRTTEPFDRWTVGDLHPTYAQIFPEKWCVDHDIDPALARSAVNRTPMGKRTEVVLDGYDPARYLPRVQSKSLMEDDEFDAVLASHELDPQLLLRGKAKEFFADRAERLYAVIAAAMGKEVVRDDREGAGPEKERDAAPAESAPAE